MRSTEILGASLTTDVDGNNVASEVAERRKKIVSLLDRYKM